MAAQRATVKQMSDELWSQRKQTIKKVAITAVVVVAAILAKRAYDSTYDDSAFHDSSAVSSHDERYKSRIDREAFSKQRSEFWKNEASENAGQYSPENLEKMQRGRAPIGDDGFPKELHHPDGSPDAVLVPMTKTEHILKGNYLKNHPFLFNKKE